MSDDISLMTRLLLTEEAEKNGLVIEDLVCANRHGYLTVSIRFEDGHESRIGTRSEDQGLDAYLTLAKSKRGRFQLWVSAKKSREHAANLARLAEKFDKPNLHRLADLSDDFEPEDLFTRKIGRTPGGRTYEVVDGPFGRRIVVVDEATSTAAQRGPLTRSATKVYKLETPGQLNGNTSREKSWTTRARLWTEPRTTCRFVERFCSLTEKTLRRNHAWASESMVGGFVGIEEKTTFECQCVLRASAPHDPARVSIRARQLARLSCSISSGQFFPDPKDWKKRDKLAFPHEMGLYKRAWGLSYYEDAVAKADDMFRLITWMFQNDPMKWEQLRDRFSEVL